MEKFLAGETNVSPLTGNLLSKRDANQLRAALTMRADERPGAVFVDRGRTVSDNKKTARGGRTWCPVIW